MAFGPFLPTGKTREIVSGTQQHCKICGPGGSRPTISMSPAGRKPLLMEKWHPVVYNPSEQWRQKPTHRLHINDTATCLELDRAQVHIGNPKAPFTPGIDTAFGRNPAHLFRSQPKLKAETAPISESGETAIRVQRAVPRMRRAFGAGSGRPASLCVLPGHSLSICASAPDSSCPKPRGSRANILVSSLSEFFVLQIRHRHGWPGACPLQAPPSRGVPVRQRRSTPDISPPGFSAVIGSQCRGLASYIRTGGPFMISRPHRPDDDRTPLPLPTPSLESCHCDSPVDLRLPFLQSPPERPLGIEASRVDTSTSLLRMACSTSHARGSEFRHQWAGASESSRFRSWGSRAAWRSPCVALAALPVPPGGYEAEVEGAAGAETLARKSEELAPDG